MAQCGDVRNAKEGAGKKGEKKLFIYFKLLGERSRGCRSDAASNSSSFLPSRQKKGSLWLRNKLSKYVTTLGLCRRSCCCLAMFSTRRTCSTLYPWHHSLFFHVRRNYFTGCEVKRLYSKLPLTFKLP